MMKSTLDLPPLVLVCCCERKGGVPACGSKGREVLLALVAALERSRDNEIHVVATSCLGHCALGGVVVCESKAGIAWTNVEPKDAAQIITEIRSTSAGSLTIR